MKKICLFCGVVMCLMLLSACATTTVEPKYFTDQAIWAGKEKEQVYDKVLMALQLEGFGIYPIGTSRESGLIVTEKVNFYPTDWVKIKGYYKLQILISELGHGKIMVNISPKGGYRVDSDVLSYNKKEVQIGVNNKVSDDLKSLFASLDRLLGKAEYKRRDRLLIWE